MANLFFEAPGWVSTSFDPTLGFLGEGPALSPIPRWRFNSTPDILHSASLPSPGSKWRRWAFGTLQGTIPLHPEHSLTQLSTADDVHFCLFALPEAGNSSDPIAARIQGHPQRLAALLGTTAVTSIEARVGSAYNFLTRPFQHNVLFPAILQAR